MSTLISMGMMLVMAKASHLDLLRVARKPVLNWIYASFGLTEKDGPEIVT